MATEIQRFGSVIGINPEKEKYYRDLHQKVWPEILEQIQQAGLQNFSIFITELEGKKYLFSYFEYTGNDFASDMEKMSKNSKMQTWWEETSSCQIPLHGNRGKNAWSAMEMLFHQA
jgi:L-rhamnose mutarotase